MIRTQLTLQVNGRDHEVWVRNDRTLLDVLHDDLGMPDVRYGCAEGVCGTCTVLLDGDPVSACSVYAVQAEGHEVVTLRGWSDPQEDMHPLQRCFLERGASQCGFCTAGMLLTAATLAERNPDASREEIRHELVGNLCRCTGYQAIVDAVEDYLPAAAGRPDDDRRAGHHPGDDRAAGAAHRSDRAAGVRPGRGLRPARAGARLPGRRAVAGPPRLHQQGPRHPALRRRLEPARHGPRQAGPLRRRPGEDRRHRHLCGRAPGGCGRRADRGGRAAQRDRRARQRRARRAHRRAARPRRRPGALRRRAGRDRGRHRPGDGCRGRRPGRGHLRAAARRPQPGGGPGRGCSAGARRGQRPGQLAPRARRPRRGVRRGGRGHREHLPQPARRARLPRDRGRCGVDGERRRHAAGRRPRSSSTPSRSPRSSGCRRARCA